MPFSDDSVSSENTTTTTTTTVIALREQLGTPRLLLLKFNDKLSEFSVETAVLVRWSRFPSLHIAQADGQQM